MHPSVAVFQRLIPLWYLMQGQDNIRNVVVREALSHEHANLRCITRNARLFLAVFVRIRSLSYSSSYVYVRIG
jgi:hypothetical protein